VVFWFFPTTVPVFAVDWSQYPALQFLKATDVGGNAFPSLHVAFAVFTAVLLGRQLRSVGAPAWPAQVAEPAVGLRHRLLDAGDAPARAARRARRHAARGAGVMGWARCTISAGDFASVVHESPARCHRARFSRIARAAAANTAHRTVRVSAPPGTVPLAQGDRWPGISLDIVGELRSADLQRRDADIAIRFMRPTEPGLAARKLGELAFRLYAAPVWLTRAEGDWRFLGYSHPATCRIRLWPRRTRPFVLRSNDLTALHNACRGGLGLAMLRGELVEVPGEAGL
jgi:hypothetical protein